MDRFLSLWKKFGMFALLMILLVVFSAASPKVFLSSTTFYNILKQASVIGVLSCGITMELITGGIDISVASRVACITILSGKMLLAGWNIWAVVLFGILFGAVSGALNAILAELLHTYIFVISMATNYVWTGICYLAVGASTLYGLPNEFKSISQSLVFGHIPSIILIFAVCAVIASFILSKTYFGRYIYAIGGNREAAYLAGIDVVKTNILTHTIGGAFIGIGAIILMSRTMTAVASTSSASYAFDCITACVLGGIALVGGSGKMYQAVLGVLVINVLFNGLTILGVSDYWQMVVKGGILFLALGIDMLQRVSVVDPKKHADQEIKQTV